MCLSLCLTSSPRLRLILSHSIPCLCFTLFLVPSLITTSKIVLVKMFCYLASSCDVFILMIFLEECPVRPYPHLFSSTICICPVQWGWPFPKV